MDLAEVKAIKNAVEGATVNDVIVYELSFPDDENMVWSIRQDDKVIPKVRWRR